MKVHSIIKRHNFHIGAITKCFIVFILITTPLLIITPVLKNRLPFAAFIVLLFSGWLFWTFTEYIIHRFLTHTKSGESSKHINRHMHHHKHPTEIKISTFQRAVLGVASAVLLAFAIFWNNYFSILAGLFLGFSYSFFSHWMLHQKWSQTIFPRLFRFHVHHHCKHPDKCFGFSTTLWDRIFKTTPPEKAFISDRIIQFYYGELEKH